MLALRPGAVVLDATVGWGGHAEHILERVGPSGRLIGLDRDEQALAAARQRLERFGDRITLVHGHFGEMDRILDGLGVKTIQGALFDLGVSSLQLEEAGRGFSFAREGPLDMRMDPTEPGTAGDIVNHSPERELREILWTYGEERWAGRIARAIVRRRPLATTTQLAEAARGAVPKGARRGRIDPATRTFQAIRIAVNREVVLLPLGLSHAIRWLGPDGRIVVLSYHSLEDRIVKVTFREQAKAGVLEIVTGKPLRPSAEEVARNPRSRSARLRAARRLRQEDAAPRTSVQHR